MSEWAAQQVPSPSAPGTVTLVEGTAFCVSTPSGDILPGGTEGVFFRDTRLASRWELLIDSEPVEPMAVIPGKPYCATFVGRSQPRPNRGESTVLVSRTRYVGAGLREDIEVHNFGVESVGLHISLKVESDLAGIFDVKAGRITEPVPRSLDAASDALVISSRLRDRMRGARVSAEGASVSASGLFFVAVVPPRDSWRVTALIQPIIDAAALASRLSAGSAGRVGRPGAAPGRLGARQPGGRDHPSGPGPGVAMQPRRPRLAADLRPRACRPAAGVAAGAPVVHDPVRPRLAAHLLDGAAPGPVPRARHARTLAALQGTHDDPPTEEEPGKILHELRFGVAASPAPRRRQRLLRHRSTPPRCSSMLLGELRRWGVHRRRSPRSSPHADRGPGWIDATATATATGSSSTSARPTGAWSTRDGRTPSTASTSPTARSPEPPIALAEVQGYVYAAYVARAALRRERGDSARRGAVADRATRLQEAFNERFWLPDRGWYASASTATSARSTRSPPTWVTACGPASSTTDKAAVGRRAPAHEPEMFTGWGVRTLALRHGRLQPDELPQRLGLAARQRPDRAPA